MKIKLVFYSFILLSSLYSLPSQSGGKGPNGLWPITERYILVSDKSLPGLVLVDIVNSLAVERLIMPYANPVCVASCPECNFILVTGNGGKAWKIQLSSTPLRLIKEGGKLNLNSAPVLPIDLSTAPQAPLMLDIA